MQVGGVLYDGVGKYNDSTSASHAALHREPGGGCHRWRALTAGNGALSARYDAPGSESRD